MHERFLAFWQAMVDGKTELLAAHCHTYSNVHDHMAWFFPDVDADSAALGILSQLAKGTQATRQPAKLRLVLDGLEICHLPFAKALVQTQAMQQIDMQIGAIARTLPNCVVVSKDADLSAIPGIAIENWAA